jgi:hypothetical protein
MDDWVVIWGEDMYFPFARGLLKNNNESNSQEQWYGVSEETQKEMCGVKWLMCGGRMG